MSTLSTGYGIAGAHNGRMISLAAFAFVMAALFGSVVFAIQQEADQEDTASR